MHEDEPAIGVALCCARLASHIGANAVLLADGAARALVDHGAHHLQQLVVVLLVPGFIGLGGAELSQHLTIGIFDAGDQLRRGVAAGVGNASIGVDHLQQRDGAGAQCQRRHGLQRALAHTQRTRQLDDAVHAHFLHHFGSDGVLGIGQCIGQRHGHAGGVHGIGRAPDFTAGKFDLDLFILACVFGLGAFLQRRAIDKGLEGGAGLAAGLGHVVKRILRIVAAAHPGQHGRVARVHGQETCLHAGLVVAQVFHESLVGQQLLEGIFRTQAARLHQFAVGGRFAHQLQHQIVLGAPAIAVAPVGVRNVLQRAHLAVYRLLGPVLQPRINGGAHHQTVGVDVVVVLVRPGNQPFAQLLRKVRGHAYGLFLALEVQTHGALFQALKLIVLEFAALDHLAQHRVAPGNGALGVDDGVVVGIALEHAHQRGALQHRQLGGGLVEIRARRHLNAIGVVEEGNGVQIGLKNLVLGIERLDLEGRDRFLELAVDIAGAANFCGVEVARQLLGDGGAALRVAHGGMHHRAQRAREIHAVVLIEAVVFRGHQRLDHRRRNLLQRHPLAVAALELSNQLAVGAHDLRGLLQLGFAQIADAGRERNQQQHIQHKQHGQGHQHAQPFAACGPAMPPGQGRDLLAQRRRTPAQPQRFGLRDTFFLEFLKGQTHVARRSFKGRIEARLRRMPKKKAQCIRAASFLWFQPRYLQNERAHGCKKANAKSTF